jgi:peptide chain release factor 2
MEKEKTLLFSLTKKDFVIQTFCTGGNGGQHRNAKQNGVRIIHPASGARAEHRDGRDQVRNKEAAFVKLTKDSLFLAWHSAEVAKRLGQLSEEEKIQREVNRIVDEMMRLENLKIETVNG